MSYLFQPEIYYDIVSNRALHSLLDIDIATSFQPGFSFLSIQEAFLSQSGFSLGHF